jgi:hypothetical protein
MAKLNYNRQNLAIVGYLGLTWLHLAKLGYTWLYLTILC